MSANRTYKDYILLVIKGIFMGTANKIPGVSGGMVAFVMGFYEEFIYSLQKINRKALMLLSKGRFRLFFKYINFKFLGLLILGMVISYFSVSKILDFFISRYELYVWALFFGMIFGSVIYIIKSFEDWNLKTVIVTCLGLIIGITIGYIDQGSQNENLWFIFFCGIISVSGMVIPGLSGSFILVLIGNYVLLLVDSVNVLSLVVSELIVGNWEVLTPDNVNMLYILAIFTLGSLAGMMSFAQLLNFLLKRFHNITIALIIGFIAGSLRTVWPWRHNVYKTTSDGTIVLDSTGNPIIQNYDRFFPSIDSSNTWIALFFIALGIFTVLILEYYEHKQKS